MLPLTSFWSGGHAAGLEDWKFAPDALRRQARIARAPSVWHACGARNAASGALLAAMWRRRLRRRKGCRLPPTIAHLDSRPFPRAAGRPTCR